MTQYSHGLTQGTVKVIGDPEAGPKYEDLVLLSPASPGSVVEEGRNTTDTPF
jgi:hypothetical protein